MPWTSESRSFVTMWNVTATAILLLFTKLFFTWIYRLTFHPLAKYPGPWLAKVSDIYGAYYNGRGCLHLKTEIGHRKYGPVFRQGPNKLVFNTPTALHAIYSAKAPVQKSKGYQALQPGPGLHNIVTVIDKVLHRHKRKVLSHGFSEQAMKAFEPNMLQHVDQFIQNLTNDCDSTGRNWSAPINMTERTGHLQYDVMGKFGFGQSFDMQKKPDNHFLVDAVNAVTLRSGIYSQYPKLASLKLDKLLGWKIAAMRARFSDLMTSLVQTRVAQDKNSQADLFSFLVDAKNDETGLGFTQAEMWAESRFLLIAGADTTRTSVAAVFFYLTAFPECYKRLVAEIRNTFHSPDDIKTGTKLAQCQYLRACVDETLRISPPLAGTLWREVCAGGMEIDSQHVPAGTDVGISIYAMGHNERIHSSPSLFMPERWIVSKDNPQESVQKARHGFQPFSIGPRSCIGRTMAYMELLDTVAKTCWHLDFKRAEGFLGQVSVGIQGGEGRENTKEFQLADHVTSAHKGPYIQFRLRVRS